MSTFNPRRLFRAVLMGMGIYAAAFMPAAQADAPQVRQQAPAYYRMMLGEFEITALLDGAGQQDIALLKSASEQELKQNLAQYFIDGSKAQSWTNAYLINTGKNLVLVDTGCGSFFGPTMGKLLDNIRASGYRPEQIDTILITHMHTDHIGGLVDTASNLVFPNATVHVNKVESDFWLSNRNAVNEVPEGQKKMVKQVQDIAGIYRSARKWNTFKHRDEVVPGIVAVLAGGHTPGHTMFRVKSGDERFFIIGDTVHNYNVQFARPDVSIEYDIDQKQAVVARYKIFNLAAKYKWLVGGMHLPYPGMGKIRSNGDGTYTWLPLQFTPLP